MSEERFSTVWITGASAGLGAEFARQLAGRTAHMVLTARREERLMDLANLLAADHPALNVTVLPADLSNPADRLRVITELKRSDVSPDLLVNNAGLGDYGEFATADWCKLEAMIRVNMEALTHLAHAVLPGMIRNGVGAILNVSSLAGSLPIPDFAVYAATKAYVTSFSEALGIELKSHGVRVLALCPGPVHTEFGEVARRGDAPPVTLGRGWFHVPKEQVVREALSALERGCARIHPSWKTAAAALVIGALPVLLVRALMSRRPRRQG